MFESIPDYRKIVLILILIQKDKDLLKECGFLKKRCSSFKFGISKYFNGRK